MKKRIYVDNLPLLAKFANENLQTIEVEKQSIMFDPDGDGTIVVDLIGVNTNRTWDKYEKMRLRKD